MPDLIVAQSTALSGIECCFPCVCVDVSLFPIPQENRRVRGKWDTRFAAAIDRVAAQISEIDIDIRKSQLKAPFDGRISRRVIDEGAVVAAGTPIVTLLESGRRQVRVGVPPRIAASLKPKGTLVAAHIATAGTAPRTIATSKRSPLAIYFSMT